MNFSSFENMSLSLQVIDCSFICRGFTSKSFEFQATYIIDIVLSKQLWTIFECLNKLLVIPSYFFFTTFVSTNPMRPSFSLIKSVTSLSKGELALLYSNMFGHLNCLFTLPLCLPCLHLCYTVYNRQTVFFSHLYLFKGSLVWLTSLSFCFP